MRPGRAGGLRARLRRRRAARRRAAAGGRAARRLGPPGGGRSIRGSVRAAASATPACASCSCWRPGAQRTSQASPRTAAPACRKRTRCAPRWRWLATRCSLSRHAVLRWRLSMARRRRAAACRRCCEARCCARWRRAAAAPQAARGPDLLPSPEPAVPPHSTQVAAELVCVPRGGGRCARHARRRLARGALAGGTALRPQRRPGPRAQRVPPRWWPCCGHARRAGAGPRRLRRRGRGRISCCCTARWRAWSGLPTCGCETRRPPRSRFWGSSWGSGRRHLLRWRTGPAAQNLRRKIFRHNLCDNERTLRSRRSRLARQFVVLACHHRCTILPRVCRPCVVLINDQAPAHSSI